MNKYVLSNVNDTLYQPPGQDNGSIVVCLDHLAKIRKMLPDETDRVFDARLFPGGEEFPCESCANAGGDSLREAMTDAGKGLRAERASALYRLTVACEFARLDRIASRLAGVAAVVVAIIGYREWERLAVPYLDDSWIAKLPLLLVAYLTCRLGSRWLMTGRFSRSHQVAAEQGVAPDGRLRTAARRWTPRRSTDIRHADQEYCHWSGIRPRSEI